MRRESNRHGPTLREQEMIELHDAGLTFAEVGLVLDLDAQYVRDRLTGLSVEDSRSDVEFWKMIRSGSKLLGERITQIHGRPA